MMASSSASSADQSKTQSLDLSLDFSEEANAGEAQQGSQNGQQGPGGSASEQSQENQQTQAAQMMHQINKRPQESLAQERGVDWCLRGKGAEAVPVTRPIRIECFADRVIIVSHDRKKVRKEIRLSGSTVDAIDAFVHDIDEHVAAWGMAGRGLYWRPVLNFYVAQNGVFRYEDIALLLEGSGMIIRRKSTIANVPNTSGAVRR